MDSDLNKNVNDAIKTGISGEAVAETMKDILDNKNGEIPKQFEEAVEVVVEMKSDKNDQLDPNYTSNLVKNNSNRIKDALKSGIDPNEVAVEISKASVSANTQEGYKKLNFVARFISKMKQKQRKKEMEKQQGLGGIQKVYKYKSKNSAK